MPAFAAKRNKIVRLPSERVPSATSPVAVRETNLVNRYLTENLKVEDLTKFNMTLKMKMERERTGERLEDAVARIYSTQSAKTIGNIVGAFSLTEYNNAIVLAPAGSGKTFLLDQLTTLFSFGQYPEFLKPELGFGTEGQSSYYQVLCDAFLGNTDVILVSSDLLSHDNTKVGKAMSSEEMRMRTIITGLADSARREFQRTDDNGKRIGRRTILVFNEVATLPPLVQDTLKTVLDETGFHDPADPVRSVKDPGFVAIAMTTPDEYRSMVAGDSAVERRYVKVEFQEPTDAEAFRIVRAKADAEWTKSSKIQITDDAIRFIVRMNKLLDSPPLAMPASVLRATDLLFSWKARRGAGGDITLADAQEFLMRRAGLTDVWFDGPNGEPPFHDFSERVKKLVIGQDEVVDKISDRIKAWARFGFGGDVPIFFLGGPSGSGKDTLVKALNEVMFGHDGHHLMVSIGGAAGFGINAIIEGPPRGNHSDGEPGLLVQRMENGPANGLIAFNEGKDTPSLELEKFKVFVESGEIRPMGKDSRVRPLKFPVFILGQWGEEIFEGKTDSEIAEIYAGLTQRQVENFFLEGRDNRSFGAVSRALLDRAKKTGGVFMLMPVAKRLYPDVVNIPLKKVVMDLKTKRNIGLHVSPPVVELTSKVSIDSGDGLRGTGATLIDFTETAISKAIDQGLPTRNVTVEVDVVHEGDHDFIVVKSGDRSWKFDVDSLRRIKMARECEAKLLGK